MGYKTDKNTVPNVAEDVTWDSAEGEALLAIVKENLTPRQVAVLAKYKELYPTGMGGFAQIMSKAEGCVKKKW